MSDIYSKPEKHFLILGTIILLLLPEIANYSMYRSGLFDRNVEFLKRECLQGSMYSSQTIYYGKSVDCDERAKWLANSWSDLLVPVIGLIIFWWWFLGNLIFNILRMIPFFDSFIERVYDDTPPSPSQFFTLEEINEHKQEFIELNKRFTQNLTRDMFEELKDISRIYVVNYPELKSIAEENSIKELLTKAINQIDGLYRPNTKIYSEMKSSLDESLEGINIIIKENYDNQ
jgi:hypothetical protein